MQKRYTIPTAFGFRGSVKNFYPFFGRLIIEQFINSTEVEIVHLTPVLFSTAFARYKKYADKEWGLVDCISFEVMQERGIREALTVDRHFVQAGFVALMAPKETD